GRAARAARTGARGRARGTETALVRAPPPARLPRGVGRRARARLRARSCRVQGGRQPRRRSEPGGAECWRKRVAAAPPAKRRRATRHLLDRRLWQALCLDARARPSIAELRGGLGDPPLSGGRKVRANIVPSTSLGAVPSIRGATGSL